MASNGPRDYAPPHLRPTPVETVDPPIPRALRREPQPLPAMIPHDTYETLAQDVERAAAQNIEARQVGKHPALAMPYARPTLLHDLAEILVRLPFGDMMALATGITAEQAEDEPAKRDETRLAKQIHAWATKTYEVR